MKNILMTLVLALSAPVAFAGGPQQEPAPAPQGPNDMFAYSCQLTGDMSGIDLGAGISGEVMGGQGVIQCMDRRAGELHTVELPVRLTVLGIGPGFDFSVVRHVSFVSGGLGYVHSPLDLTGQFDVGVSAGLTFLDRGIAVDSAVSVKKHLHGLAFELGFMGEQAYGLGAHVHGMVLIVNPIHQQPVPRN